MPPAPASANRARRRRSWPSHDISNMPARRNRFESCHRLRYSSSVRTEELSMAYEIEGRLLEVCTCHILCPCWVGEDPDGGTCDGVLAWNVDKGAINGTDVAGRSLIILCHIPGNILKGNWKVRLYIDDKATPAQKDALLAVWGGKLGGPIADLAKLIGEVVSVEQAPVTFDVQGVNGTLKV